MNNFDLSILSFLNTFVNRWPHFDVFVVHIQHDNLAKGGLLLACWWYCWFQPTEERERLLVRARLIAGLVAMTIGIFVARALAYALPFRVRPLVNPDLHFVVPDASAGTGNLAHWSAFPSDHAVAWFSIAATVFLVNRRIGWWLLAYTVSLGLGRVYIGYHHPTDILGGAAIGVLSVLACNTRPVGRYAVLPLLEWERMRPAAFYAIIFLATYEISNLFDEVRAIAPLLVNAVKHIV